MKIRTVLVLGVLLLSWQYALAQDTQERCSPTRPDAEGPFYKPAVPLRDSTGKGLVVEGAVLSAGSCESIEGARVEWWQTGPDGSYDDEHRGAMMSDGEGRYSIKTDFPAPYPGRPPHIHFKILAPGHRTLTTQVYPRDGQKKVPFNFVLVPE